MDENRSIAPVRLYLLITVVNRKRADYFTHVIEEFDVNLQFRAAGSGTADSKILEYLGLSDSLKSVLFSIVPETRLDELLAVLEEKFVSVKDGKGISMAVPLSSVIGTGIFRFMANDRETAKEQQ